MQVLYEALETFCHHKFTKNNENDLNKPHDYGMPFSEQQCTHCKSFDRSDPPEWPQILDIH